MSTIVEMRDISYYENRAVEMIREARIHTGENYQVRMTQAISLLALARAEREIEDAATEEARQRGL